MLRTSPHLPALAIVGVLVLHAPAAHAFEYLEHSFFSDRACLEAQKRLGPHVAEDAALAERYLALSLFCPEQWSRPYCADGYKQLEGSLNRLEAPPASSHDHPVTLGDFAALPDHMADFGPVQGTTHQNQDGVTAWMTQWLYSTGDAGGVTADVAEDACETQAPIDWDAIHQDLESALDDDGLTTPPAAPEQLSPLARAPLQRGPRDPSGAYSFDNPRFLDLVLRNHDHFGATAFANWRGFHAIGKDLAAAPCERILGLDEDAREDLADGLEGVAGGPETIEGGCAALGERVRRRAIEWASRASPALVAPVRPLLDRLQAAPSPERDALTRRLAAAVHGVVFVGAGLHFLQDGFSAGHIRVDRSIHNLEDSRYYHDLDGEAGVTVHVQSGARAETLVIYGDGFLLGAPPAGATCSPEADADPATNSACLLRRQRGWVLATTTAALIDWASGAPDPCTVGAGPALFACAHLPHEPPHAPGLPEPTGPVLPLRGTLPAPPPAFSYQSILLSTSIDAAGGPPQVGARAVFLSQLGARANWMTSYHFGLLTRVGGDAPGVTGEFSYMFHWRWAARWLINAGPFMFAGLRTPGDGPLVPHAGVGPSIGTTVLPEGWIRLPLEVTLTYRVPLTLADGERGIGRRAFRVEAHWLEIALGLAFM